MYRRSRRSLGIWQLIVIGALAGIVYLLFMSWQDSTDKVAVQPTTAPTQVVSRTDEPPPQTTTDINIIPPDIADARIIIPSAAINQSIIQVYLDGTSWNVSELGMNVGHLEGTSWLDDGPGNIVLSGHVEMRDGRAGVFANLSDLQPGDAIMLEQDGVEQWYQVTEIYNVEPDDLTPVYPSTTPKLTLITCDAYNFISNSYEERIVVVAEPLES